MSISAHENGRFTTARLGSSSVYTVSIRTRRRDTYTELLEIHNLRLLYFRYVVYDIFAAFAYALRVVPYRIYLWRRQLLARFNCPKFSSIALGFLSTFITISRKVRGFASRRFAVAHFE